MTEAGPLTFAATDFCILSSFASPNCSEVRRQSRGGEHCEALSAAGSCSVASWPGDDWRPDDAWAFSSHKRSGHGGLVFALLALTAVEVIAIHVLLALWSPVLAWIITALSLYGALWLLADYRASILRPVLVDSDDVWLRAGLRWQARVPRRMVSAVVRTAPRSQECTRSLAFLTTPNLWLEFSEPISLAGPYGIRRRVRKVGLFVDNPAEFERFVNSAP
jgi:hypothetical protein